MDDVADWARTTLWQLMKGLLNMFSSAWYKIITDPKIKQVIVKFYQNWKSHNLALLTTPDYVDTILDKDGNEIAWDDATKAIIQAENDAIDAKIAALS